MDVLVGRAPTRIDFGGGWTDVPPYSEERGGIVCNAAIDLHAVATVRRRGAASTEAAGAEEPLARAAKRRFQATGAAVSLHAEFPVAAGLGGSSAAGVAVLGTLASWRGESTEPATLAEESRRLEVEDLGVAGGRQDHYAAAFGGVLGLRFSDRTEVKRLRLPPGTIDALNQRCVVAYTGQSRLSGDTITAVLDAYRRRDRRVLESLDRMRDLAGAMNGSLERGDVDELGVLVGEHWVYQRALHPAIPTPGIDAVLAAARTAGALGGKALGASGGGCVLAISAEGREADVRAAMAQLATLLTARISGQGFHVVADGAVPPPPRPFSPAR